MIFVGLTAFISLMAITIHFLYKGFKKVFSISTKTKRGFFMRHATVFFCINTNAYAISNSRCL